MAFFEAINWVFRWQNHQFLHKLLDFQKNLWYNHIGCGFLPCFATPVLGPVILKRKDNAVMLKKILRIAALVLALTLVGSLFPAPAATAASTAAESEAERITALANSTYKKALRRAGRGSFLGWCGAAVDWQMQVLGITTKMVGTNGNAKFDQYRYEAYSSGGYTIDAYPRSKYNLEKALNAITANGTKNAYNLMVGFQSTNTAAGRYYGHAVFVYAILDGVVYFTESFGVTLNGQYYREGRCITATIAEFAKYYNKWCTFDGIIDFGLKSYSDECQPFNAYLYATVTAPTTLYSEPCTPDVDERSVAQRQLQPGERLSVIGMYCNTQGQYWYKVEDVEIGYVLASDTQMQQLRYDDVTISGAKAPTVLTEGSNFSIRGSVTGMYSDIVSVRAQVFMITENESVHVMTTNDSVVDNDYTLYKSRVGQRLSFRQLSLGSYHFEVAAVVSNHYYADGDLQSDWQTIKLWKSDFQVVERKGQTANVTFDACGGTAELNAAEMNLGQALTNLPGAQREGYLFDGWYTEAGELVDEDYVLEGSLMLYAHWVVDEALTGWFWEDGRLYYMENGSRPQGFFQVDGVTYYQNQGLLEIGWATLEGKQYYFHATGAMAIGWLTLEDGTYYMNADGQKTIGWAIIEDNTYYFDAEGRMVTGAQTIDGGKHVFDEHGALVQNTVEVMNTQVNTLEHSPY